jgi:hypothetical protein
MKLKKLALITLLILPLYTLAQNSNVVDGVTIVSANAMATDSTLKKQDDLEASQLKTQGYISTKHDNAKYLLNIKASAPAEIKAYANSKDPYDTHLKQNISEINLTFPYKGVQGISDKNVIGYAATGTVVKGGWTGVKEIFNDEKLGVCSLDIESRRDVKMQVRINADRVSYAANNNPTTTQVEGDPKFGFRYSIFWISNKYNSNLDCATRNYDPTLLAKMVSYSDVIARQE